MFESQRVGEQKPFQFMFPTGIDKKARNMLYLRPNHRQFLFRVFLAIKANSFPSVTSSVAGLRN